MFAKTTWTKFLYLRIRAKNVHLWRYLLLLLSSVFFIGTAFVPGWLNAPGLNSPEAIGKFLNGKLPTVTPQGGAISWSVVPAFPNLKFKDPLVIVPHPNQNIMFVGSRQGVIHYFTLSPTVNSKTLFGDLSDLVAVVNDGGFLGMAFHPDFGKAGSPNRNYVYVYYSAKGPNGETGPNTFYYQTCFDNPKYYGTYLRLARYEVYDGTLTLNRSTEQRMVNLRLFNETHRGGGMTFGKDGFLYLTIGDQARTQTAQDISSNFEGGVIRIDVDRNPARSHAPRRKMGINAGTSEEISGVGYYVPNDNPWQDTGGSIFEEFYSIGHRAPHRMTMDKLTGDMWVGEVGHGSREEINFIQKGGNGGWPLYEGNMTGTEKLCNSHLITLNRGFYTPPVVDFLRTEANAIIGGYVYRGSKLPSIYGKFICGDYSQNRIFAVTNATGGGSKQVLTNFNPGRLATFGQDHEGELYLGGLGDNVSLYTLQSTGGTPEAPSLLSQTGAFKNLSTLEPTAGVIPYEMVEPFWSDGAQKFRWMAIPNDGSHNTADEKITFSENGNWDFPKGAVLIKHFELGGKRLETRFEVKGDDGQYYFLTYKWNSQGTDAQLLTASLDETLLVNGQNQVWHYPSRSECQTCHQSSVGSVLGPKTRYLNKSITYPKTGVKSNQLVTLSYLGILNQTISEDDVDDFITLVSKDDPNASLELKARSYLDVNCSYCHQPATGNRAVFDARITTPLNQQNLINGAVIDPLGIQNAAIIAPQSTARSIIYHRMNQAGTNIAMPTLGKNKVDAAGVLLISNWINSLQLPNNIALEAECALVGSKWSIQNASNASQGKYLSSPNLASPAAAPTTSADYVTFTATVSAPGSYGIFARTWTTNDGDDSFWVRVNGGTWYNWNKINYPYAINEFTWNQAGNWSSGNTSTPLTFTLNAGNNQIDFAYREPGARLDKIILVPSGSPIPTGFGDNAPTCGGTVETPITLSPIANQSNLLGSQISLHVQASGGTGALSYSAQGLPPGLGIQAGSGLISGTISGVAGNTYNVTVTVDDSDADPNDKKSVSFAWTVTAPVSSGQELWLEAECAQIGANWNKASSPDASKGEYLNSPNLTSLSAAPASPNDYVSFQFDISQAGTYKIFARTLTTNDSNDSFWIRVDGGTWYNWNKINSPYSITTFTWNQLGNWTGANNADPLTFNLGVGSHQLDFAYREPGAKLDKIAIVPNNNQTPSGLGGNNSNCGGVVVPNHDIWMEAECATVGALWTQGTQVSASNGKFLTSPNLSSILTVPSSPDGLVTFQFNIDQPETYKIFARTLTTNDGNDSFWIRVDMGVWYLWNKINYPFTQTDFTWNQLGNWTSSSGNSYTPLTFDLGAGSHTVDFAYREPGLKFDKILITQANTPTGIGQNASNCSAARGTRSTNLVQNPLIEESVEVYSAEIYPNPSERDGLLSVRLKSKEKQNYTLRLVNLQGETVLQETNLEQKENTEKIITLRLKNLAPGLYLLFIENKNKQEVRKLIIR
ncbi:MAG: PQQ-dependent sugar dehydrogenase [Microscillaceae bacterium]|nr:PQQ-dependent sugar dehydrogenase [Microscillaceae bacterium]